jgi:protein-L-isoaspartate(D-aspartate) O-methyltransferase
MSEQVDGARSEHSTKARMALAEELRSAGRIKSDRLAAAFCAVPREAFMPADVSLDVVYGADESVVTKRDDNGAAISSISAPFIQALMIEQAELQPGMSVLEVGSGGYNAALLAEVVGEAGRVLSVDIDAEVVDRARAALDATGYGGRVEVVVADAEHSVVSGGQFDAIIVTVGAWDIPPAWLEQLADSGRLVLPLRMNGVTRSIAFRRQDSHMVSTSAEVCGFVPMQGAGLHQDRVFLLPDQHGGTLRLLFDSGAPQDPGLLDGVLRGPRVAEWSGVTVQNRESFADLHLWFASYLNGFCRLAVDGEVDLADPDQRWFPFGGVRGDSFAYLALRLADGDSDEFGAYAYGPHAAQAATAMIDQIQAWDRHARPGPAPQFAFWPPDTPSDRLPAGAAVLEKTHGLLTITWPKAP